MVVEIIEQIFFVFASVAAVGFLVSGLDDLFFDSQFLVYLWKARRRPPLSLQDLKLAQEQWIALMVPAWQEGGIVNKMAEYAARVVLYEKYDIFIGVYPNDPETNRCVDDLCAAHPRIHKVVVPHPGPTSKADCLNSIYRAMRLHEVPGVREYAVVAIHDAEDVMHPLVLKVYNYFVPRTYDMAQLPVFALELSPWRNFVANTYIDDFAELHTKDLFVRESIGGVVPSAGVGTAFSRQTLDQLSAANGGDPFRLGNLTEDYEVAIRVKRAGLRTGIVSVPVERIVRTKHRDGTWAIPKTVSEIVAVRENFPTTFRTAVRQRSRWILGISFQTWEQAGWAGTLPMRYTLARDRRAPLTHVINLVGYLALFFVLFEWVFRFTPWASNFYFRPILTSDGWLWKVVIIDTWLLGYRAVQKFISVAVIYDWRQAIMSIPRVVVGNFINIAATMNAARIYLGHKLLGRSIVWMKTDHTFPGEAELAEYTKSIEDLLVEGGLVTREQIFDAVRGAPASSVPSALLRMGLVREEDFTSIWSRHSGLTARFINPYVIAPPLLDRWPESRSLEVGAMPVGRQGERVIVAFREPPAQTALELIGRQLGAGIIPTLAQPSHLAFARNRAYPGRIMAGSPVVNLPEKFRGSGPVDAVIFLDALTSQQAGRHSLPDVIVDMALMGEGEARRVWADVLRCPPCTIPRLRIDRETFYRAGPFFWWLHRMLPVQKNEVACAALRHPKMVDWLAGRLGASPSFLGELPRKLEVALKNSEAAFDPEKLLLDSLGDKGILKPEDLSRIQSVRRVITDPMATWLRLQNLVTEEQLNEVFLETFYLPRAREWQAAEVQRLAPVLPPGFAEDNHCFCLEEVDANFRIGLGQLPSAEAVHAIYDRLSGCSIWFQALNWQEVLDLRKQVGNPSTK